MKIDDRDDLTDAEYEVQEMDIEQADQEVRAPGGQNMCKGGGGEGGGAWRDSCVRIWEVSSMRGVSENFMSWYMALEQSGKEGEI